MIEYVLIYALFTASFIASYHKKYVVIYKHRSIEVFYFFGVIVLMFFSMLRYDVGADYMAYFNIYEDVKLGQYVLFIEPVFLSLLDVFPTYTSFIVLSSILYVVSISTYLYKYSANPRFSFILYLLMATGYVANMSFIRQSIALSLILMIYSLFNGKRIVTFISAVIMSLLHSSAILMVIIHIVPKKKINNITVMVLSLLMIVIYKVDFHSIIISHSHLLGDYAGYLNTSMFESNSGTGILAITSFLLFVTLYTFTRDDKFHDSINVGLIYVLLLILTIKIPLIFRLNIYFAPFYAVAMDRMIEQSKFNCKYYIRVCVLLFNLFVFVKLFTVESFNEAMLPYNTILGKLN